MPTRVRSHSLAVMETAGIEAITTAIACAPAADGI
jgi:hypothetical protein